MPTLISDDLAAVFEGGVSVLVGTRDADRVPEATRGMGAVVHPDRRRVTVFLPVAVSERAIANLRANGLIAVGFSSILDSKTVQVKGRVEELRDASEAEREVVMRYVVAFAEVLFFTGIPRAIVRDVNAWPCHAVTF